MQAEAYRAKEITSISRHEPYERWNILKNVHFNPFHVSSEDVTFELVERGMSAWSHHQKAAYMTGDEAYAGSRNYKHLEREAREVFGIDRLVPTHNGLGADKLLATTLLEEGQWVAHNRRQGDALVRANGGRTVDVTGNAVEALHAPTQFGANVDPSRLEELIRAQSPDAGAYVMMQTCPQGWNGQPFSMENLEAVRTVVDRHSIPLVVDLSNGLTNAYWMHRAGENTGSMRAILREIVETADILTFDASRECRSDVGGFITSHDSSYFDRFRNQVVVFEGLHTYGGMTGRAMEVMAQGLSELKREEYIRWHARQVADLYDMLADHDVPAYHGGNGIALDADRFLPQLEANDHPKFVLAAALYIHGGVRGRIDGRWADHATDPGRRTLNLELPRNAYSCNHLREIADIIVSIYNHREEITGLDLVNDPEFVDEAKFEPKNWRLFVSFPRHELPDVDVFEPYKIAIFEPVDLIGKEERKERIEKAGYNTFLLDSEDVYIDLLTDSGTSAMSSHQWEGMTNTRDTPYSSPHYERLVDSFSDILGYDHVIPTHQGRAAEHIMSQTMIEPGQIVPGNMYFTTTKLHQEAADGTFVDVIVDEAYDPTSSFPWKGNIDLDKLRAEIDRVGAEAVAYVSFELSVNMAGGQPVSMENLKAVSRLCEQRGIPLMFDATRCMENAYMIKEHDPEYAHRDVKEILRELMSYGDGCTVSCKKDFLVNMGGVLACNKADLARRFRRMVRVWEGKVTDGGLDPKDMEALHRGFLDSLSDDYIEMRVERTRTFGRKLQEAGIPIVEPPGTHAVFLDAKRFLPHLDQDEYPAQALAAAIYLETGVRTMERGNVSKGRNPETGENYRPALELVRCTLPRRVYTNSHLDYVVEGIKRLYDRREQISGLRFTYEPDPLRFFQGRFEPLESWTV